MPSSAPFRRRAAFLDFDGTLAESGIVPRAQAEAVLAARAAGHAILLSTGRPASIVASDVAALFDGMITSAGGHLRIGEELLRDVRFPAALARRTVEVLEAHGAAYALEAPEALWCSASSADRLKSRRRGVPVPAAGELGRGFADILEAISVPDDPASVSFAKISVWSSPVPIEQLAAEIGSEVGALPNSISEEDGRGSGELHLAEVDKADGMRLAAEHLGLGIEDTVAVGDGPNDLGMLRAAGTAVAIRGSRPEVLAAADMEVAPPSEHGVEGAFARLGML
ncbi:HAD hydrolase family protein [Brachybacterium paraconglomeratum]|uniref:HAD hydrolase family protein n=1 Tax=Brachybacterium paraconglomeratum TaxID=173362 RepID=UPI0037CBAC7A